MNEWVLTTLGAIANLSIGRTPDRKNPSYWTTDTTHPFCTIADIPDGSWRVNPAREGITELAIKAGKAKRAPAGSLLMSFKLTIGRVGFAERDVYPNEAIVRIDPRDRSTVDDRYLAAWLESHDLTENAPRAVKGKTLNSKSLALIPVALPPLHIQERIAELIAAVDDQIYALGKEAEALDALLQARREALFTHYTVTGTTLPIGQVLREVKRPITVDSDAEYRQIGIRSHGRGLFLKEAVTGKSLGSKKVFWVEPGDLVINIVFAWEGAVAVVPPEIEGYCGSHRFPTYRRSDGGDIEFFRLFFSSRTGTQLLSDCSPGGAGRNRTLNRQRLMQSPIALPSASEQDRAVVELHALDAQIVALRTEETRLRQTRAALLSGIWDRSIDIEFAEQGV